jgi:hypothetical protein
LASNPLHPNQKQLNYITEKNALQSPSLVYNLQSSKLFMAISVVAPLLGRFLDGVDRMEYKRYCLKSRILAVFDDAEGKGCLYVPAKSLIDVQPSATSSGSRLIDVTWNGRTLKMFSQDLEDRADVYCSVESSLPLRILAQAVGGTPIPSRKS